MFLQGQKKPNPEIDPEIVERMRRRKRTNIFPKSPTDSDERQTDSSERNQAVKLNKVCIMRSGAILVFKTLILQFQLIQNDCRTPSPPVTRSQSRPMTRSRLRASKGS